LSRSIDCLQSKGCDEKRIVKKAGVRGTSISLRGLVKKQRAFENGGLSFGEQHRDSASEGGKNKKLEKAVGKEKRMLEGNKSASREQGGRETSRNQYR